MSQMESTSEFPRGFVVFHCATFGVVLEGDKGSQKEITVFVTWGGALF